MTVLGHVDPHDILQHNRWKRRKRKGKRGSERKSYVKGKVRDALCDFVSSTTPSVSLKH